MAGTRGRRRAMPRLSPSAMSASCWAAKAASEELRVAKMAPAMVVPVKERVVGCFEVVRVWMVGREMGLVSLEDVMHLALSMAMVVDRVAAIGG
ncbi:hypothetical protein HanIR_Chr17g0855201 [Helianthus annuus]|nr:hypothetical protein HanIR_Chr17g0855201 [Helianthus annuus]